MKFAIFGRKDTSVFSEVMPKLINKLNELNAEVYFEEKFLSAIQYRIPKSKLPTFKTTEDLKEGFDYFVTFGGDGTILEAATLVHNLNIPIIGFNVGRLGYLAGMNVNNIDEVFNKIKNKEYRISQRSLIEVQTSKGELTYKFALNEMAVTRKETTSMITVDTWVDNEFLNSFWADGLIVSTPTGSTGYSLSCNGPIITPNTKNFVITPIAPHNLNVRPLIVSDTSEMRLKINSRVPEYSLSLDSRLNSFSTETEIFIKKAPFHIHIVQLNNQSYLQTLRKKLFWGSDRRN